MYPRPFTDLNIILKSSLSALQIYKVDILPFVSHCVILSLRDITNPLFISPTSLRYCAYYRDVTESPLRHLCTVTDTQSPQEHTVSQLRQC
jgi:hypothetical protein